jgi:phosphoribosyl-AMP cyclohydrolase
MKTFTDSEIEKIIKEINFTKIEGGLVPVIVQDEKGKVLTLAFSNKEAIRKSLETGHTHFFSRSRKTLWKKGEISGNIQEIKEVLIDCDQDSLLFKVHQTGGGCHTGYYSCFYRIFDEGEFKIIGNKLFDPEQVYKKN